MINRRAGTFAALSAAAVCTVLTVTGCTASKVGPTTWVTVTVPPPSPAAVTSSPAPTSAAPITSAGAPSATASASVVSLSHLPGQCAGLLPLGSVMDAVGGKISGGTAYVVGLPDPSIGRVGYIDCRYGVVKSTPTPAVEIGVNLYRTPAKAAARIAPTVTDYTQHAAKAQRTTILGAPATILQGGVGAGYDPTLVVAIGQRTIAVSVRDDAVASGRLTQDLTALATLAARRTS
jgi:hypothetical protein